MSFYLQETYDLNFAQEGSPNRALDSALALSRYVEAAKKGAPASGEQPTLIYPQFHVIGADKVTRNRTCYTTEAHKGSRAQKTGQHSFTKPYPIPLIGDHRATPECGGEPSTVYGRMVDAKLVKNTESGKGHLAGLGEVTHPEAIDEILSGRWLTGSLGSSVHDASCSICGEKFNRPGDMEYHAHQRGGFYRKSDPKKDGIGKEGADEWVQTDANDRKGQMCYTAIGGYQAREYSRVVVPSDDESIVNVLDTANMPGSHFTKNGAPINAPESDSNVPTSHLWVPMSASSRANISHWGERYIDLATGQERSATDLGLYAGDALVSHYERILSGEDALVMTESYQLSENQRIWPNAWDAPAVENVAATADTTSVPNPPVTQAETTQEPTPTPPVRIAKATPGRKVVLIVGESASFNVMDQAHYAAALRSVEAYAGKDKSTVRAKILQEGRRRGFTAKRS